MSRPRRVRKRMIGLMATVLLTATALLVVAAPAAQAFDGPLRVSTANSRYFTDNSGKPILLTGSHTWPDLQDWGDSTPTTSFDYEEWLNLMQTNGQNFFRMWTWENTRYAAWTTGDFRFTMNGAGTGVNANSASPWNRSATTCCAADGGNKFDLNLEGTLFNQAYFNRLHERVEEAAERGIYVSIMLFQGWSIDSIEKGPGNPWPGNPFNVANNVNGINGDTNGDGYGLETHTINPLNPSIAAINELQKAYIRKVVDTVDGFDNVLYEVSNEDHPSAADTEWQNVMIDYLKEYEATKPKQHPVGMTAQCCPGGNNTVLFSSSADWVSPSTNYQSSGPANGEKVVISDTDHIFGYGGDAGWVWETFLRGANPVWMDLGGQTLPPSVEAEIGTLPSESQQNAVRRAMGEVRVYSEKLNLDSAVPDGELSSTGYALADPGSEYLVFQPSSGSSFTVNLEAGTYEYEWLNVAEDSMTTGSVTASGGNQSFTPPFSGYAALYIRRSGGGEGETGTFLKGVNLDGPAVTIEGNAWESYSSALEHGFSTDAPNTGSASLSGLTPTADAETTTMLDSVIWREKTSDGEGFSMSQSLPDGTYQVYLWIVENYTSDYRDMDIKVDGATAATGIGELPYLHWQKYGPYTATVTEGSLTVDVLRHSKGDPEVSGIAIYSG